ncbi:MAG: hypothetical protein M4579_007327 [Chaenotheca gracillima]|nr:MAG: hypothetical protein M4579_007327 [Chaenotheca gracillima]
MGDVQGPRGSSKMARPRFPPTYPRGCTYEREDNLFVKSGVHVEAAEVAALQMIQERLQIPVPHMHDHTSSESALTIKMDFIEGRTLWEEWPETSADQKLDIVKQLKAIVNAMRSLEPDSAEIGSCDGGPALDLRIYDIYRGGPFSDEEAFNDWLMTGTFKKLIPWFWRKSSDNGFVPIIGSSSRTAISRNRISSSRTTKWWHWLTGNAQGGFRNIGTLSNSFREPRAPRTGTNTHKRYSRRAILTTCSSINFFNGIKSLESNSFSESQETNFAPYLRDTLRPLPIYRHIQSSSTASKVASTMPSTEHPLLEALEYLFNPRMAVVLPVAVPWKTASFAEQLRDVKSSAWRFTELGIAPFEFAYDVSSRPDVSGFQPFISEPRALLDRLGLTEKLGICVFTGEDPSLTTQIEFTQGRANITLPFDIAPENGPNRSIEAVWRFDLSLELDTETRE